MLLDPAEFKQKQSYVTPLGLPSEERDVGEWENLVPAATLVSQSVNRRFLAPAIRCVSVNRGNSPRVTIAIAVREHG